MHQPSDTRYCRLSFPHISSSRSPVDARTTLSACPKNKQLGPEEDMSPGMQKRADISSIGSRCRSDVMHSPRVWAAGTMDHLHWTFFTVFFLSYWNTMGLPRAVSPRCSDASRGLGMVLKSVRSWTVCIYPGYCCRKRMKSIRDYNYWSK